MNYKLSRSTARALAAEYPVGHPFSGPAYAHQRHLAALPGHRDFVGDIVEGVFDAGESIIEGAVDLVEDVAKSPIGQIAATAVGFAFGGPLGAALAAGGMSLVSGADPLQALLRGGMAYMGSSIFSSATGIEGGGGFESLAGEAVGDGVASAAAGGESLASTVAGTATDPNQFLLASANPNPSFAATVTDVTPGLIESSMAGMPPAVPMSPGEIAASGMVQTGPGSFAQAAPGAAAGGGGIIDSVMKWGKENPLLASGVMQVAGGALGGIGNNITANQIMDKKVAAERELQAQKTADAMALEEWKRRFVQGGSYGAGKVPFAPASDTALRRPDGTLVYSNPGLVMGAMNG